jgi:type III secretory pathway component EscS|tara:strand:- start:476 stop:637 length:162 start_codon:yes stop_codon:yes gene_type:complete
MLGIIITGIIFSTKVIKEQKLGFGIPFLIIFIILLLIWIGGFLIGFLKPIFGS